MPPSVVTVTSTAPLPAGAVAVIEVALLTVYEVAAVVPNVTAVAAVKYLPVMVTLVPPASGPAVGLMPVTDGVPVTHVTVVVPEPPPTVSIMNLFEVELGTTYVNPAVVGEAR